jgi:primosomal protein N' (replication factor Y)
MPFFADVILPLSVDRTFTYSVSEAEFHFLKKGMRLAVPFGKNKLYTGLVAGLHQNPPELYQAKEIHQILDEKPIVTEIQLEHWKWVASYYMCATGDVYRSAMPSPLLLESETVISLPQGFQPETADLDDEEFLVVDALNQQPKLSVHEVSSILGKKTVLPLLRRMMDKGLVALDEEISEGYKPKLVRYVRLAHGFDHGDGLESLLELLKNAEKQRQAVMGYFQLMAQRKPISVKELAETAGVTPAVVKALADKEIFEEYTMGQDRVNFDDAGLAVPHLSEAQQAAFDEITRHLAQKPVSLLHGVTASGKTEIYIRLIERAVDQGKQVLYLVPEIALTTQLVSRLTKYFGNSVAVYHSKYSSNERVEVWQNTLSNSSKARIVIGARSALFLPFAELGLVIVDEEHEQLFKQQDPAPRYHARDAAVVLAKMHGAKVLLGSATPSIESYHNARAEKYGLVSLTQRFGNVMMPDIELVDLKDKYFRKRMSGHFSDTLIEYIGQALELGEQIILFQNRRGYAPVLECMTCGHVPQCKQCDVSLTYHKHKGQLRCHYCGYAMAKPSRFHQCASVELTTRGFGTEQVQMELHQLFPKSSVGRMDQDTTRGKFGFERIIDSFKNRELDILVGTQMLAKGLDFDNVSLVGIMNADNMLYHPDFRAFERSYQMMAQVAGRSGRSAKRGKVVIQTYNPLHDTIQQVVRNDYEGMFAEQLYQRKIYHYPPFFKLVRLTLRHRDYEKLRESAMWLYNVLAQNLPMPVLGPEEPGISRIRNEYIRTVMVKIPPGTALEGTKKTIRKILDSFGAVSAYRAVKVTVNVDFY